MSISFRRPRGCHVQHCYTVLDPLNLSYILYFRWWLGTSCLCVNVGYKIDSWGCGMWTDTAMRLVSLDLVLRGVSVALSAMESECWDVSRWECARRWVRSPSCGAVFYCLSSRNTFRMARMARQEEKGWNMQAISGEAGKRV